ELTGHLVAVKMLREVGLDQAIKHEALLREAKIIRQLNHPNIVRLHAIVRTDQGPAMILDWVDGGSLQDYLKRQTPTQAETVDLVKKLADAVAHAHAGGVLHRDIKPSNVLLKGGSLENPMLCDFGLAKSRQENLDFSSTNVGLGTAGYMAPEMISRRFGRISQATDVYSLGALCYRLLTGVIPHEAESPFETLERTCDRNVIAPSYFNKTLDWNLETICLKCLDRDPVARYASADELKIDLERFQRQERIIAGRVSWQRRLQTWSKEHPWIAVLSALLCLLFITSSVILAQLLRQSQKSQQRAEKELARSVETFRLATPLIKRYLQLATMNPAETKRIVKIADLLKEMGNGEENLRQRYDIIYSGLEIARELFQVKDQRSLAVKMTREARESLRKLIDEHGSELDRMGLLVINGKIEITLLDQAMVRYGHACIQSFEMIKKEEKTGEKGMAFLMEAIDSARKVTEKNPNVDEAFTDLANYYVQLYDELKTGPMREAATDAIQKAFAIHERLLKNYPNDVDKILFWAN
ncbi:MAG: serine/threonine-protein kinase, partial [bacterium]